MNIGVGNLGGGSIERFTGFVPYRVIAINPTLAELKEAGIDWINDEPTYKATYNNDNGDVNVIKVTFWLKSQDTSKVHGVTDKQVVPITFNISETPFVGSTSGKTKFINKFGRTTWAMSAADLGSMEFYSDEASRPCHKGEEELAQFVINWLNLAYNTKKKDNCQIDVSKIINLDFSELKNLLKDVVLPTEEAKGEHYVIKVLTGAKEGTNQNGDKKIRLATYQKMFLRGFADVYSNKERIEKKLADEYSTFNVEYYTLQVEPFDESKMPTADAQPEAEGGDLPFDVPAETVTENPFGAGKLGS